MLIHQIWFDLGFGSEPPHRSRRESFAALNANARYRLWSEADALDLMRQKCPHLLHLYHRLPHGINRCDLFRYVLMYYEGGFYFDVDFVCLRPLSALLDGEHVVLCEEWPDSSKHETVHNGALCSPRYHLLWQFVFDEIEVRLARLPERGTAVRRGSEVLKLTGTAMLRDVAMQTRGVRIATNTLFCPLDWSHLRHTYVYPEEGSDLVAAYPQSYCALLPAPLTWRR